MDLFGFTRRTRPIHFYLSEPAPCPYIEGKVEHRLAANIAHHPDRHDDLARAGFRRVENSAYRPICADCTACQPIRIVVGDFTPSRGQRRIRRRNADLHRRILPNISRAEHFHLFRAYIKNRHPKGYMMTMDSDDYANMVGISPIDTVVLDYRLGGQVLGVMLVDLQSDGLSAVYSFFDPDIKGRSLGIFMVLDLIHIAQNMAAEFIYLGYTVAQSRAMNYKAQFRPAQILHQGQWVDADSIRAD